MVRNRYFGLLAGALFTGIVSYLGYHFVMENGLHYAWLHYWGKETGDLFEGPITPDLEWPTWIVYSAIPLGSGLMCFRFLQVLVSFNRTGELPHVDHGHVEGLDDEEETKELEDTPWFSNSSNLYPKDLQDESDPKNKEGGAK